MSRGNNREPVTAEMAIGPEQAVDINPAHVQDQFLHFLDRPSEFSVDPLIDGLVAEAFPNNPEASQYFGSRSMWGGRQVEDEISRFPVFPLSKMRDFDQQLVDMVFDWSYPMPKYSFGPQNKLNDLIARSDSEYAHRALVEHIIMPFPRDRQTVFDGPDEMQYKSRLVGQLYEAATYHATPDLNPWATNSLFEVYKAIRPGGFLHEIVQEKEVGLSEDERRYRTHGPDSKSLRDLQESMLARFMEYPHPVFDRLVQETLDQEPVDQKRLYTVISTLINGRIRKREDGFYEDIIDQIVAPYDEEIAQLVKQHVHPRRWERTNDNETESTKITRQLSRRIIRVELLNSSAVTDPTARQSSLLRLAVQNHPLSTKHLERRGGNDKFEWTRSENYYEDLGYLLSLVHGPNIDGVRSLAAWKIAESFQHDYSYDDKPNRAKAIYMSMSDAVLSADPSDYPALIEHGGAGSVMDAMNAILRQAPQAIDRMTDEDIDKLMAYREAYETYVASVFPDNLMEPPRDKDGRVDNDVYNKWSKVTALSRDFEAMSHEFAERLEWREIQTRPQKYTEWMQANVANYAANFAWHVKRDGQHARGEQRRFNAVMSQQAEEAKAIFEQSQAGEDVEYQLIHFVAKVVETHRDYMRGDLRYDNEFYHKHATLMYELRGNLPHSLKVKALKMIEAGEVIDFLDSDEKEKLRRKVNGVV